MTRHKRVIYLLGILISITFLCLILWGCEGAKKTGPSETTEKTSVTITESPAATAALPTASEAPRVTKKKSFFIPKDPFAPVVGEKKAVGIKPIDKGGPGGPGGPGQIKKVGKGAQGYAPMMEATLTGVMKVGNSFRAIISTTDGILIVRKGSVINEWKVIDISDKKLVFALKDGTARQQIELPVETLDKTKGEKGAPGGSKASVKGGPPALPPVGPEGEKGPQGPPPPGSEGQPPDGGPSGPPPGGAPGGPPGGQQAPPGSEMPPPPPK